MFATKEILHWLLKEKGVIPENFVIFADSRGDFEIAETLFSNLEVQAKGSHVKVLYLGSEDEIKEILDQNPPYEIEIRHHDDLTQGTADFLQEQKLS